MENLNRSSLYDKPLDYQVWFNLVSISITSIELGLGNCWFDLVFISITSIELGLVHFWFNLVYISITVALQKRAINS